jgi:hypothetical protein
MGTLYVLHMLIHVLALYDQQGPASQAFLSFSNAKPNAALA